MNHRSFVLRASGALIAALLASTAWASAQADPSIASWQPVDEAELARMRGGLDIGGLVGTFAIERLVRIDGEIVAQTHLLISGLERLSRGVMPDVSVLGNLANLIQVGAGNQAVADAASAVSAATATATPASAAPANGSSGAVTTTSAATGLSSEFGTALAQAVAIANGEDPPQRPVPVPVTAAQSTVPAAAASTAGSASSAPSGATNQAAMISITIPVGNGSIVVTGIPNGTALATSIQNSVQATRIETETRISASLASLAALRSATFSAALRQQAIDAVRR